MPIYFYAALDDYACFSNFSPHGIALDGVYWPTVEHYFQAQKFAGAAHADAIRRAATPKQAKTLGRRRDWPLRSGQCSPARCQPTSKSGNDSSVPILLSKQR